jgi:hypothetical protein
MNAWPNRKSPGVHVPFDDCVIELLRAALAGSGQWPDLTDLYRKRPGEKRAERRVVVGPGRFGSSRGGIR